jgi:hypothetical protein
MWDNKSDDLVKRCKETSFQLKFPFIRSMFLLGPQLCDGGEEGKVETITYLKYWSAGVWNSKRHIL